MSKQYLIKSRDSLLEEYVVFVADGLEIIHLVGGYNVSWELSHTDTAEDATKFNFINDAFVMMEVVGLHENDWEVVLYEET